MIRIYENNVIDERKLRSYTHLLKSYNPILLYVQNYGKNIKPPHKKQAGHEFTQDVLLDLGIAFNNVNLKRKSLLIFTKMSTHK